MRRLFLVAAIAAGCGSSDNGTGGPKDMTINFNQFDFATQGTDDGGEPNACGDFDPTCQDKGFGPDRGNPFPLSSDKPPDPNESDDGVGRDKNGWLGLNSSQAAFDYLWLANTEDWGRGSITKMDSKVLREVARYFTLTCNSLGKGDRKAPCDGKNGCCAADSYPQYQARVNKQPDPGAQNIQLMSNDPSRTAVDFNGDVWVANRAFGGQSSVTKIANDPSECIDRNGNGKIDTSKDTNGDGIIQTDCNGNGQPDDIADVKATPCQNGLAQEFYGLDDECVLFSTNTNVPDKWGRPLGLGPGAHDFGPSDAWAGTYNDGHFFRIDGTTGQTKEDLICQTQPYGVAIDSTSIAWAPPLGSDGKVCYFSTKIKQAALVRDPQSGPMNGYGVSLDRDQNVWFGGFGEGTAYRYTPDRSKGFNELGQGGWIRFNSPGANTTGGMFATHRGVAADSRTPNTYWVWLADDDGWIIRIPGSMFPPNKPLQDMVVDGSAYPAVKVAGTSTIGAGVDRQQNVWGISLSGTVATRIKVDQNGMMTMPDINSPPMGNNKCPAGDRCAYADQGNFSEPAPYTYSDFTGFGLRNFTRPTGFYRYVQKGCVDGQGGTDTKWVGVAFDADVPLNTTLTLKVRTGDTPIPDQTWGQWAGPFTMSPADLLSNMVLVPNLMMDGYLQVEFDFQTQDKNATPKLKDFDILFECPGGIG